MSKHESRVRLRHMLDYAREALALSHGKSRLDLDTDRLLNLALTRLLEMIGEAANQVPREKQADYPEIPWPQVIGLRNRLIHGYDIVDFDILWQIVTTDLPPLIAALEKIVPPEKPDSRE